MAGKYQATTLRFFIQDTATNLGVTGKTASGDYTSLKISQDGVLSSDLKASLTITDEGGGWYSVALTALQSNYDCLAAVPIPATATYQGYGVTHYTSKVDNVVGYGPALAASGAASTITLAADPYGADNIPNGSIIAIIGGTGVGQNRTITGYVSSTKVVTVGRAWVTNPDNTSIIIIKQFNTAKISANLDVYADVNRVGGTAQTARDIGASVLLSSGTGTGQLDFTSGVVKANLVQILATALTETAGYIAAGFKKFFNVATPISTVESVNQGADNNVILASASKGLAKVYDDMAKDSTVSKPGTAQTISSNSDITSIKATTDKLDSMVESV